MRISKVWKQMEALFVCKVKSIVLWPQLHEWNQLINVNFSPPPTRWRRESRLYLGNAGEYTERKKVRRMNDLESFCGGLSTNKAKRWDVCTLHIHNVAATSRLRCTEREWFLFWSNRFEIPFVWFLWGRTAAHKKEDELCRTTCTAKKRWKINLFHSRSSWKLQVYYSICHVVEQTTSIPP